MEGIQVTTAAREAFGMFGISRYWTSEDRNSPTFEP